MAWPLDEVERFDDVVDADARWAPVAAARVLVRVLGRNAGRPAALPCSTTWIASALCVAGATGGYVVCDQIGLFSGPLPRERHHIVTTAPSMS